MTVGKYVITANVAVTYPAIWSEIIQGAANIPVATPAVPATTVAISNPYGVSMAITIAASGATITAISTGSNSANLSPTGLTSGTVFLPNDWAISVTYSGGTPTWTWVTSELPQSGASSQVCAVSSPAPPGGQLGTLPQMGFTANTPIVLDNGSQLYSILNGSGYLRAYVQGSDDVNHSWLGNLGGAMLLQPAMPATSNGTGTTNTVANAAGSNAYVSVGDNGATMANYFVSGTSVATTAHAYMMTVPPGGNAALQYTVASPVWYWSEYTVAIPSSGSTVTNASGRNLAVIFLGNGSVSAVSINGVTTNINQSPAAYTTPIPLPAGATITPTYSATLVWAWLDPISLVLPHSDGTVYAQSNLLTQAGAGGFSPLTALSYPVRSGASMAGLIAAVSN